MVLIEGLLGVSAGMCYVCYYYVVPKIGDILLRKRAKESYIVPPKKITCYYNYKTLLTHLTATSTGALEDVMIEGYVGKAVSDFENPKEFGPAGIVELKASSDEYKSIMKNIAAMRPLPKDPGYYVVSPPFRLWDADLKNSIIIKDIDKSHGFISLFNFHVESQTMGTNTCAIRFDKTIAAIGDAKLEGNEISFHPKKVGDSVELLIKQESMFKLRKAVIVIGVVSLIIVAGFSYWLYRKKQARKKKQNLAQHPG